jgi:hypothetical protein
MFAVKEFESFNGRRKSNPWIAKVNAQGKVDFSEKVGGYTGAYGKGEAGILYIREPQEGQVYAWGQKDYRKFDGTFKKYVVYENGKLTEVAGQAFLDAVDRMQK